MAGDDIASKLVISSSTVKNQIYYIYRKAGVHSQSELLNVMMCEE